MPRACPIPCAEPACESRGRVLSLSRTAAVFASASGKPASAVGGVQVSSDSVPRKKFLKDLITVGEYVSNQTRFTITRKDLDRWVENGKRFLAAGNQIPVPDGHTDDATANRGYVLELFREDDTLFGVIEMIGDDGIKTAARSKVSINTEPDYTDGKGNHYDDLITHVALTNSPVVPDQDGFMPIAASRTKNKVHTARLFTLADADTKEFETMKSLITIAGLLGIENADGMDEAALTEAIAGAIKSLKSSGEEMSKKAEATAGEVDKLKLSLAKATQKPDEPGPVLLRIAGENRSLKLSKLVDTGKITPAVKDKLADIYIGKDNAGLKLSLDAVGDGQFTALVEALEQNDPAKLGEQTGVQNGVSLSRVGGAKDNSQDKDTVNRLAAHLGIKTN